MQRQLRQFEFVIVGVPYVKRAPQFRVVKTKSGKTFVHTYKEKKAEKEEIYIKNCATEAFGDQPLFEGPLQVNLCFYVPIPKSFSQKKRDLANQGNIVPVTRPDLDNYVKLLQDGMNGIIYKDDNLIVDLIARKRYSDNPGTTIIITGINFDEF